MTDVIVPEELQEQVSSRRWDRAVRISLFAGGLRRNPLFLDHTRPCRIERLTSGARGLSAFAPTACP